MKSITYLGVGALLEVCVYDVQWAAFITIHSCLDLVLTLLIGGGINLHLEAR